MVLNTSAMNLDFKDRASDGFLRIPSEYSRSLDVNVESNRADDMDEKESGKILYGTTPYFSIGTESADVAYIALGGM